MGIGKSQLITQPAKDLIGLFVRHIGKLVSQHFTPCVFHWRYLGFHRLVTNLNAIVALEVATQGITVNNICPGYVWTSLVENQIPDTMKARGLTRDQVINDVLLANQPQKKFVQVEQLAALAVFLCREEASAITGTNLSVDGGWTAQ